MNPATQSAPRTAPGAHNPSFESENPLSKWVKDNKGFLLLLVVVLLGGLALNSWLPKRAAASRVASWELFNALTANPAESFSSENLANTLSQSRDDDRIHQWVVLTAINFALTEGDEDALATLSGEFDAMAASGSFAGLSVPSSGGAVSMEDYVRGKLAAAGETAVSDFTNPAPTGERVRLKLRLNDEQDLEFVLGLYPDVAPVACARFLEAVRSGRMLEEYVLRSGSFGLRVPNFSEEGTEEALPLEARFGYFHNKGVLSTQQQGGGGEQSPLHVELAIQDTYHLDAKASVFGAIVEGIEQLEDLAYPGPGQPDPIVTLQVVGLHVEGEAQPERPSAAEGDENEAAGNAEDGEADAPGEGEESPEGEG